MFRVRGFFYMRVLMIGDVVAKPGRIAVLERIQDLREQNHIDLAIMNAENLAGGFSVTPTLCEQLFSSGTLTVDSLKVAILAALHIADELHRLKNMHEQADSQLAARSAECAEMLDRLLKVRTTLVHEQGGAGKLSLG